MCRLNPKKKKIQTTKEKSNKLHIGKLIKTTNIDFINILFYSRPSEHSLYYVGYVTSQYFW